MLILNFTSSEPYQPSNSLVVVMCNLIVNLFGNLILLFLTILFLLCLLRKLGKHFPRFFESSASAQTIALRILPNTHQIVPDCFKSCNSPIHYSKVVTITSAYTRPINNTNIAQHSKHQMLFCWGHFRIIQDFMTARCEPLNTSNMFKCHVIMLAE